MMTRQRITHSFRYPLTGMSAKTFLGLAGGVIALVGGVAGAARWVGNLETKPHADSTFLSRTDFAVHQQAVALIHQRDSLNAANDKVEVLRLLSGLDSSDHCRRGFRSFCR